VCKHRVGFEAEMPYGAQFLSVWVNWGSVCLMFFSFCLTISAVVEIFVEKGGCHALSLLGKACCAAAGHVWLVYGHSQWV
jgi:hypothetical protein